VHCVFEIETGWFKVLIPHPTLLLQSFDEIRIPTTANKYFSLFRYLLNTLPAFNICNLRDRFFLLIFRILELMLGRDDLLADFFSYDFNIPWPFWNWGILPPRRYPTDPFCTNWLQRICSFVLKLGKNGSRPKYSLLSLLFGLFIAK